MKRAQRECSNLIKLLKENQYLRDGNPGRGEITGLQHGLQMAAKVRKLGLEEKWITAALIHDAAKPLTEVWHGLAVAEIVREYAEPDVVEYLRDHPGQAFGPEPTLLGRIDATSFDPLYNHPDIDDMFPYIERLYGIN